MSDLNTVDVFGGDASVNPAIIHKIKALSYLNIPTDTHIQHIPMEDFDPSHCVVTLQTSSYSGMMSVEDFRLLDQSSEL